MQMCDVSIYLDFSCPFEKTITFISPDTEQFNQETFPMIHYQGSILVIYE